MKLLAPTYYKKFKCLADACRHSCCIGWEIDVDEDTLSFYDGVEGDIGEIIRTGIEKCPDGAHFKLCKGERCALLDERGLCRIISALGEGALCDICREHPRFYNTVGEHMECGIGAACEAAAALILAEEDYVTLEYVEDVEDISPITGLDFDAQSARETVFSLLCDRTFSLTARITHIIEQCAVPSPVHGAPLCALLESLEYLDGHHREELLLLAARPVVTETWGEAHERFLAYLVYRHASTAQTGKEFSAFLCVSVLLTHLFDGLMHTHTPVESARIISEEMEYSEDNMQALLTAAE